MITTPFPLPIMLDAADRKALRARAHHLDPVVMVGEAGLTRAVVEETDRALRAHELIKIRVLGDDRDQRRTVADELCSVLGCAPVQAIGKLLVLYRPRPIEETGETHTPKKRIAQKRASPQRLASDRIAPKRGASKRAAAERDAPKRVTERSGPRAATAKAAPASRRRAAPASSPRTTNRTTGRKT